MTTRKRRNPTPGMLMPPPYQPITGERATLNVPGMSPYCALMQVAAEDTHDDYVVCRGYDTRFKRFFDYDATDLANKPGIAVAKPYSRRVSGSYQVAEVFPAVLPLARMGQNPGVAANSKGHPGDLDEEVEILYDENDVAINWMLLDAGTSRRHFELKDAHTPGATSTAYNQDWDGANWVADADTEFLVTDVKEIYRGRAKAAYAAPHDAGSLGTAVFNHETLRWEMEWLQPHALRIYGLTKVAVAAVDGTFGIDGHHVMQPSGSIIVDQDPNGDITIQNTFACVADENGKVEASWDENDAHWKGDAIACPA